jgi:hypothetical protein
MLFTLFHWVFVYAAGFAPRRYEGGIDVFFAFISVPVLWMLNSTVFFLVVRRLDELRAAASKGWRPLVSSIRAGIRDGFLDGFTMSVMLLILPTVSWTASYQGWRYVAEIAAEVGGDDNLGTYLSVALTRPLWWFSVLLTGVVFPVLSQFITVLNVRQSKQNHNQILPPTAAAPQHPERKDFTMGPTLLNASQAAVNVVTKSAWHSPGISAKVSPMPVVVQQNIIVPASPKVARNLGPANVSSEDAQDSPNQRLIAAESQEVIHELSVTTKNRAVAGSVADKLSEYPDEDADSDGESPTPVVSAPSARLFVTLLARSAILRGSANDLDAVASVDLGDDLFTNPFSVITGGGNVELDPMKMPGVPPDLQKAVLKSLIARATSTTLGVSWGIGIFQLTAIFLLLLQPGGLGPSFWLAFLFFFCFA